MVKQFLFDQLKFTDQTKILPVVNIWPFDFPSTPLRYQPRFQHRPPPRTRIMALIPNRVSVIQWTRFLGEAGSSPNVTYPGGYEESITAHSSIPGRLQTSWQDGCFNGLHRRRFAWGFSRYFSRLLYTYQLTYLMHITTIA